MMEARLHGSDGKYIATAKGVASDVRVIQSGNRLFTFYAFMLQDKDTAAFYEAPSMVLSKDNVYVDTELKPYYNWTQGSAET